MFQQRRSTVLRTALGADLPSGSLSRPLSLPVRLSRHRRHIPKASNLWRDPRASSGEGISEPEPEAETKTRRGTHIKETTRLQLH